MPLMSQQPPLPLMGGGYGSQPGFSQPSYSQPLYSQSPQPLMQPGMSVCMYVCLHGWCIYMCVWVCIHFMKSQTAQVYLFACLTRDEPKLYFDACYSPPSCCSSVPTSPTPLGAETTTDTRDRAGPASEAIQATGPGCSPAARHH